MTLKEELEILRGEPIAIKPPADQIPCIETSDAEKLCKNPVVSVRMITYNHEPYIRQAIEGVMMQQTDFEFELIIGEDCSQDKTREICFEYQKKYPDKIRVLWSESNVYHLGGNSTRVAARSRGEYVAFCEGDDYWTDPHKLQKQVDIMRQHPDVGLCFCGAKICDVRTGNEKKWESGKFPIGRMDGRVFFKINNLELKEILTATTLLRRSILEECFKKYDIFKWRLCLGDTTMWLAISSSANVYFLKDEVAVYHIGGNGVTNLNGSSVSRDGMLVRNYFLTFTMIDKIKPSHYFEDLFLSHLVLIQAKKNKIEQKNNYLKSRDNILVKLIVFKFRNRLIQWFWHEGWFKTGGFFIRYIYYRRNLIDKLIKRFQGIR